MLSWEYPPKNIGGLSTHVYNLSHALSDLGHEIHVITCEEGTAPIEENDNGVYVHRVAPYRIETEDFTKWVMQLNFAMIEESIRIMRKLKRIDIIHAHDWLSAYAAKALKWSYKIPMICTIHATEEGRNNGIKTEMQRYISSTEWLLTYEAWKIIGCSKYMKNQVVRTFSSPEEKVWVIPNGVNPKEFKFEFDEKAFRRQYASDNDKIIFFIGRHVFEKGIQLLIDASYEIVKGYENVKFVIAGSGPMTEELQGRVKGSDLENKFLFTGYMDNETRNKLYKVSNVAVFPSLYEPFGIVAIEAMMAGCPVVVSDVGGFSEIVEHGVNGMKMINGNSNSLKDNVLQLLYDDGLASFIANNAISTVEKNYTWERAAALTVKAYEAVKEEIKGTEWELGGEINLEMKNNKNADRPTRTRRKAASAPEEEKMGALTISKQQEKGVNDVVKSTKKAVGGKQVEPKRTVRKKALSPKAGEIEGLHKEKTPKRRSTKKQATGETIVSK